MNNKKSTTVLGFDFGMKYIGIACGQSITQTATAVATINAKDGIPNWEEILKILEEYKPTQLVVGYPVLDNKPISEIARAAKKFSNRLAHKTNLPCSMVDEQLTTWAAKHDISNNKPTKDYFNQVNAESAKLIVEQWLLANSNH